MSRAAKKIDMEQWFRVFADKTRLRLINLLGDDEVCVCFLTEILKSPQSTISRHLSYLKRAGLVDSRRDGKWMHYRIVPPSNSDAAIVLENVKRWLANDKEMQEDRKRLVKFCCSSELPENLKDVPKPLTNIQPARQRANL
jgi:ArsR family transcriptional regulator, arsenate/arsenite/antimonite-responsive transcriptional repressor